MVVAGQLVAVLIVCWGPDAFPPTPGVVAVQPWFLVRNLLDGFYREDR